MSGQEAMEALAGALRDQLLDEAGDGPQDGGAADDLDARIRALVDREAGPLDEAARVELARRIAQRSFGLGPLEALLDDPEVDEVMVNGTGPASVFVERGGEVEPTDVRFDSEADLRHTVERILAPLGRRVDEAQPLCDARLPDGSRVNVVLPPLAVDGPTLTIRRFRRKGFTAADLVARETWTQPLHDVLQAAVAARCNVLVSGGTGSGKTTTLNALSSFVAGGERIVTIEDTAELRLQQPHVVRLEARPPSVEGRGEVTIRRLVRNALRMRPDRIVVGETRGEEALDMLQAMNTGHDGSLTTIHANTPRDALSRIETMIAMGATNLPERAMRQQIAAAIQIVIQQSRMSDGTRKVTSISEITGMEGEVITMQEVFRYRQTGMGPNGEVLGHFEATGIRPRFVDELGAHGITLPGDLFRPDARF